MSKNKVRRSGRRLLLPALVGFAGSGGFVLALTGSWRYSLGVVCGPFAGGVARDWQSCCAENSWTLAPYAVLGVVGGIVARGGLRPQGRIGNAGQGVLSWAGCVGWSLAALPSYAHALE